MYSTYWTLKAVLKWLAYCCECLKDTTAPEICLFQKHGCNHRFLLCVCRAWTASKWNRNSSQAARNQQPPSLCHMICLQNCMEVKVRHRWRKPWVLWTRAKTEPRKSHWSHSGRLACGTLWKSGSVPCTALFRATGAIVLKLAVLGTPLHSYHYWGP